MTPVIGTKLWKFPFIEKTFTAEGIEDVEMDPIHEKLVIGRGFIHSFAEASDKYSHYSCLFNVVLFRCIIPKGTEYFEHEDGSEYASSKIVILKKVAVWYRPK